MFMNNSMWFNDMEAFLDLDTGCRVMTNKNASSTAHTQYSSQQVWKDQRPHPHGTQDAEYKEQ